MDLTYEIQALRRPHARYSHLSLVFTWMDTTRAVAIRDGQSLVVGRAEPADIVIDDRSLSRAHARFSLDEGITTLEDLASTNGCLVNGERITNATIGDSDSIQLGSIDVRLCGPLRVNDLPTALSHAGFVFAVSEELTRARLHGRCLSVIAIQHRDGDRVVLADALGPLDRLCGYSTQLSLLLLPEQDAAAAAAFCERIRSSDGAKRRAGIATFPALACTAEQLISHALKACKAARTGGVEHAASYDRTEVRGPVIVSACMRSLYALLARAARTTMPVLIQGETGSGKELVARAVHEQSPRAKAPFKALNCATIPAHLLESVLFGHERGAFTGADRQAPGVFEQAQNGTVFLDEVGELSAHAQAALLRVLEQHCIVRVGGSRDISVDVRVVAATHRDLEAMVAKGSFRQDLMFRLDALTLRVPPLRERKEEIPLLAELFLARAREQWGGPAASFSVDALDVLTSYSWPGNVRQLKNVVERAAVVCASSCVEVEDMPSHLWAESSTQVAPTRETGRDAFRALPDLVRDFEIGKIREALDKARGNQAQAARILGVPRRTLANKVQAYALLSKE